MTKTDHLQWARAQVQHVQMTVGALEVDGRSVPTLTVDIQYSWKGNRFSKTIQSVLN